MLKKLSIIAALSVLPMAAVQQVQAADVFTSFAEAEKKVKDEGYMVFIYPAGWDHYGEKLCKKLVADKSVRAAAGSCPLILAPIYQNRNERNNAKASEAMGKLGYPGDMSDISYPAIVFYEPCGRMYATIYGEKMMTGNGETVAELIKEKLAAKKKQDGILKKANKAENGATKARYLLESTRVAGIDWPGGLRDAIKNADPQDTKGCLAALNFGFGPQNGESIEDMLKRLDKALKNPLYSANQKQRACAAAIGHIRRSLGMIAGGEYITEYARIMQKLDPESTLGMAAEVVMRDWVREYRYGQGWNPDVLPGAESPIIMHDVPISDRGTYNITFKIVTGRDMLAIKSIRLMDGNRCVAKDMTPKAVTWGQTTQTYTLQVKKPVKNAKLELIFSNAADKRSTWGEITVQKVN